MIKMNLLSQSNNSLYEIKRAIGQASKAAKTPFIQSSYVAGNNHGSIEDILQQHGFHGDSIRRVTEKNLEYELHLKKHVRELEIESENASGEKHLLKLKDYALSVKYEETESYRKTEIKIHNRKSQQPAYSFEIKEDAASEQKPGLNYRLKIDYFLEGSQEKLGASYSIPHEVYKDTAHEEKFDFSGRVPGKNVAVLAKSMMPGVLGFTYLGDNFMALRDDLIGDLKKMVDVHESIHTPDEYETRVLTEWIMARERPKYRV